MISGESLLLIQRADDYKPIQAARLVRHMLGNGRYWSLKTPTRTQCVVANERLFTNRVVRVAAEGEKPVLRVVTQSGHALSATHDQLVSTPGGYKRLNELHAKDQVHIAPWPRKFRHFLPDVLPVHETHRSWHVWPKKTVVETVFAILDTGFAEVFDLDLAAPFNNYAANEFIVASG